MIKCPEATSRSPCSDPRVSFNVLYVTVGFVPQHHLHMWYIYLVWSGDGCWSTGWGRIRRDVRFVLHHWPLFNGYRRFMQAVRKNRAVSHSHSSASECLCIYFSCATFIAAQVWRILTEPQTFSTRATLSHFAKHSLVYCGIHLQCWIIYIGIMTSSCISIYCVIITSYWE